MVSALGSVLVGSQLDEMAGVLLLLLLLCTSRHRGWVDGAVDVVVSAHVTISTTIKISISNEL